MKTVLLGMNNPLSAKPDHALWPYPDGCTGHRIYLMLQSQIPNITKQRYCSAFERMNAVVGLWSKSRAKVSLFTPDVGAVAKLKDRTVVCFGSELQDVLNLRDEWLVSQYKHGVNWICAPHPSGKNRWYNSDENKESVAVLLEQHYWNGAIK